MRSDSLALAMTEALAARESAGPALAAQKSMSSSWGNAVSSVYRLIREGVILGTQAMPSAPWRIPAAELDSDAVRAGVRALGDRCTRNPAVLQDMKSLRLPGFERKDAQ